MLEKFVALLAPHVCIVCGREGSLLCQACAYEAVPRLPDRCYRCKQLTRDSAVCSKCRRQTALRHVWPRTLYADTAKELVYRLKFARARASVYVIVDLLDEAVPFLPPTTIVTYIPTATSRVRLRGYDQSRLIARGFSERRGLRMQTLLMRVGQKRQLGSSRKQRFEQAQGNYMLTKCDITDRQILLIDDILTTGATLEVAAALLKSAGAAQVMAAVFAQTPK